MERVSTVVHPLSFLYAVCKFLDYRVGEHFFGYALDLRPRNLARKPVGQRKSEILALAHCGHLGKSYLAQGVMDGLTLRVKHR